ncbi:ribonuclease domain-containing protein [Solilutibacter silvestris]|uniref:Guanyl-specific ribonuclease Sa n=1 Tax=Solilutibacter silvestris TaxID=1645665 RepID=A0A2K1PY95_9GAMM|nr:ribonuclease [Lysobacter silvestris]PNS07764.1 Guanyl-specific ribonuclease Sa [Lysobacter silvestris]
MNSSPNNSRPLWPWLAIIALLFFAIHWHRTHGSTPAVAAPQTTAELPGRTTADAHPLPPLSGRPARDAGRTNTSLPPEAHDTLRLIQSGGPFPYRQDGVVFGNREGQLPDRPNGYYHEYTVVTPGAPTRGTRRIITGGTPPQDWYYTDDHYRSFRHIEPNSP